MAIKTRTTYRVKCEEKCWTHYPDSQDHRARIEANDKDTVVGKAVRDGWTARGTKHYCPDHGDEVVDTEPEPEPEEDAGDDE